MKKEEVTMLYTWCLLFPSDGYFIINLIVSRAETFELTAPITWDVLQDTHVLRCRANGRSTMISGPESMNEG